MRGIWGCRLPVVEGTRVDDLALHAIDRETPQESGVDRGLVVVAENVDVPSRYPPVADAVGLCDRRVPPRYVDPPEWCPKLRDDIPTHEGDALDDRSVLRLDYDDVSSLKFSIRRFGHCEGVVLVGWGHGVTDEDDRPVGLSGEAAHQAQR